MRRMALNLWLRGWQLGLLALLLAIRTPGAEIKSFRLNDLDLALQEVTDQVDVYFYSMRLDRSVNAWNVDVAITNHSSRLIAGPVVVMVEAFSGTTGMRLPDGLTTDSPSKAYYDWSSLVPGEGLSPGNGTARRTVSMVFSSGSPKLTLRVFGARTDFPPLGLTRSLNEVGQPLPLADVRVVGPSGIEIQKSDSVSGVISFGGTPGDYTLTFSSAERLSVVRQVTLGAAGVTLIPHPRLVLHSPDTFDLTPLGGLTITNRSGDLKMSIGPGQVSESVTARVTSLTGQTLPAFLPSGWSPVQAFWLESSKPLGASLPASLKPWSAVQPGETSWLIQWDESRLKWMALSSVAGNGPNVVSVNLPGSGVFAWVVADIGAGSPPTPQVGQPLSGGPSTSVAGAGWLATGTVIPSTSPASVVAERVTAQAQVVITSSNGVSLSSGQVFQGQVTESYSLKDTGRRITPKYDQFLVAYQRSDASLATVLNASFPMRPLLLMGAEVLQEATVRLEFNSNDPYGGGVLDEKGGLVGAGNVRLLASANVLSRPTAAWTRELPLDSFVSLLPSDGSALSAAFELTLDASALQGRLVLQVSGLPTNQLFVLSRVLLREDLYGLEPVERLQSDGRGTLSSLEPAVSPRLPGVTGSGQFVLLRVPQPQGLISGIVRNAAGQPAVGFPVQIGGEPWMTLTKGDGSYLILAAQGAGTVLATDLTAGDSASVPVQVTSANNPVSANLNVLPVGPHVASISPSAGAVRVPLISKVQIVFSEPVNPATVVGTGIQILGTNGNAIAASLSLDARKVKATLTPSSSLDAGTTYQVVLASSITDLSGMPLVGTNTFTFSTVPSSRSGESVAQLIIYEPGATNIPSAIVQQIPAFQPGLLKDGIVVHGTQGTADPEVPVILVNESTGETSTVLSKPDGSFSSVITGTEQDFVSATFVNLTGSRIYVPVSRQEFDNGFVGLYRQGGILEAQSDGGPVQVYIQPESVPAKTKLKIEPLSFAQLQQLLGGTTPDSGVLAGGGMNLRFEGDQPALPVQVRFPVDLAALGYPANEDPTNAAAAVTAVRNTQEVTSFEILDQLKFTPKPPAAPPSRLKPSGDGAQLAAGFLDTSVGLVIPALGPTVAGAVQVGFNQVLVPMLFGPRPVVIRGKVGALPLDLAVGVEKAGLVNQIVNPTTSTGKEYIDVPFSLAHALGVPNALGVAQSGLASVPGVTSEGAGAIGNLAGSLISVALTVFNQQLLVNSKPLPGALVSVRFAGSLLTPRPGRIFPGMVYATSGSDGNFVTVAPAAGANYLVRATHPQYDQINEQPVNPLSFIPGQQGDLSLAGAVFKNFFFYNPAPSDTPPTVSISTVPVRPAAGQTCQVLVTATLPTGAPNIKVGLTQVNPTNLLTGKLETNIHSSFLIVTNTKAGNTARWIGTLTVDKPLLAMLKVIVDGPNGSQDAVMPYGVSFVGIPPIVQGNIPAPDTNDIRGPLVLESRPVDNGFLAEDGSIALAFNKAIDPSVTNHLEGISLSGPGLIPPPIVRLGADQQTLTLQYPGLTPDSTFRLTLSGQSIRDLGGKPLDQLPSTTNADSFTMTIRTAPAATAVLPGMTDGRGAVIEGDRLYALDYSSVSSFLNVYDVSVPLRPRLLSRTRLAGQPRDLAVVPNFKFKRSIHTDVETSDVVAVVGGDLDAVIDQGAGTTISTRGQYLAVFKMGDGSAPESLGSPIVTYRVSSAATKVRWVPPYLVYQEYGQDIQTLGLVNLQEMIIGFNASATERLGFIPPEKRNAQNAGKDLDGNGDYVGPNETLPIPDVSPTEFYGKKTSYVLQNTTQKIVDFAVSPGALTVGVTLREGFMLDSKGQPFGARLPAMYRTLAYSGLPLDISDPTSGMIKLDAGAYPRWVSVFDTMTLIVNGQPFAASVAIVSLQPDGDGVQKLEIVDISQPLKPKLINKIAIPTEVLGGLLGSVRLNEGFLEVAGAKNVVLLEPSLLAAPNPPAGQEHSSIVGFVPNAGATSRSLGTSDFGLRGVADGGRNLVAQSPPKLSFVKFGGSSGLVNTKLLHLLQETNVLQVLGGVQTVSQLPVARAHDHPQLFLKSDLEPEPNASLHYYVMVEAPGAAGAQIELGLEALNVIGRPLSNPGFGFAPVRAVSATTQSAIGQTPRPNCGASIRALPAYRLSDDPNSTLYNRYLSRAFALVAEQVTTDELFRYTSDTIEREILHSGAELRAFIDPSQQTAPDASPVIGSFAARIDPRRQLIYPISAVVANTPNRDYLVGDNPSPAGEAEDLPGTHGSISGHSGEMKSGGVDVSLPSPHMPIVVSRSLANQDLYDGPFGVGWDFNYNQRIAELDPSVVPSGLQIPIVVRGSPEESEVAGSQDLLFQTGMGGTVLFKWISKTMPDGYIGDPLVKELDYATYVSDYYLPEKRQGVFDLLVKFKDGRFERLTSEGVRFRYSPRGRLETILDRFPSNRHDLQYDSNGWLTRIDDRSVTSDRFLEFGYFRRQNSDANFRQGLDTSTDNAFLEGKICKIRDYAGRDVLYEYSDDGFLLKRSGVSVAGENDGFSGRSQTFYKYDHCRLVSVSASKDGTPIFSSVNQFNSKGKPVAQGGTGYGNTVTLGIPGENRADNLQGQISTAQLADGSKTTMQFDKMGHAASIEVSGGTGPAARLEKVHDANSGLVLSVKYPEGRTESNTYDTNNPAFRSRGNLIATTVNPGDRGGASFTETYTYDSRYNLPSGKHINANGFATTYVLSSDGRSVQQVTYGDTDVETFEYNDRGQQTSHVNHDGTREAKTYQASTGFIASMSRGDFASVYEYGSDVPSTLGAPSIVRPPRGAPVTFEYNANLQETHVKRGENEQFMSYDEQSRLMKHREILGAGKERTTVLDTDVRGFIRSRTISGVEVDGVESSLQYVYKPDELFRIHSITHPGGTVQTLEYNKLGYLSKVSLGDYEEIYETDRHGNITQIKQGGDVVMSTAYDGMDRAKTVTVYDGEKQYTAEREYFPGGQIKIEKTTDPDFGVVSEQIVSAIDALGRAVATTVAGDSVSRADTITFSPLKRELKGPQQTSVSEWDSAGRPTHYKNSIVEATTKTDGNGNVESVLQNQDGHEYEETFNYDDLDHRIRTQDRLGLVSESTARADGYNTVLKNARNNRTTYDYSVFGEQLSRHRDDGLTFKFQHNTQRQKSFAGDPQSGYHYEFDNLFRLKRRTLRNDAEFVTTSFDARNQPTQIQTPGGKIQSTYDLQGRAKSTKVDYNGTAYLTEAKYDALNRARVVQYQMDAGNKSQASYHYDKAGFLLDTTYSEAGKTFKVSYAYRNDFARTRVVYPSGYVVNETRDSSGRLTGISGTIESIASVTEWAGSSMPQTLQIGDVLREHHLFDVRGRVTSSRVVKIQGGALLTELRYQYDAADNLEMRQYLHREGFTDNFSYDNGERLVRAQLAGLPYDGLQGIDRALYQRNYQYDANGLDYLLAAPTIGTTSVAPAFADQWSGWDAFLTPGIVSGFQRGDADSMGRVAKMQLSTRDAGGATPVLVAGTLVHNGVGNLTSIDRADGVHIDQFYQPGGLRYQRKVTQGGSVVDYRHFVYDDTGRLLEEYDVSGQDPKLLARYFYLDSLTPCAADFPDATGTLRRHYLIQDHQGSVVAVADRFGNVEERIWYDPFGQPVIEPKDTLAPEVKRVVVGDKGQLFIELSEPVTQVVFDLGQQPGIRRLQPLLTQLVSVPAGKTELPASVPGFAPYSVIVFTPDKALTGTVSLTISAGKLTDDWDNHVAEKTIAFAGPGKPGDVVYTASGNLVTDSGTTSRSTVGNSMLFHGLYLDDFTGLMLTHHRVYDPYSAMFLEPDPAGYEDSVNLYAAFGNNPVNHIDPSGLEWVQLGPSQFTTMAEEILDAELSKRQNRDWGAIESARAILINPMAIAQASHASNIQRAARVHHERIFEAIKNAPTAPVLVTQGFQDFHEGLAEGPDVLRKHLRDSGFDQHSDEKLASWKEFKIYFSEDFDEEGRKVRRPFAKVSKQEAYSFYKQMVKNSNKGGSEIWYRFQLHEKGNIRAEAVRVDQWGHLAPGRDAAAPPELAHLQIKQVGFGEPPHYHMEFVPLNTVPIHVKDFVGTVQFDEHNNVSRKMAGFDPGHMQRTHVWFKNPPATPSQSFYDAPRPQKSRWRGP